MVKAFPCCSVLAGISDGPAGGGAFFAGIGCPLLRQEEASKAMNVENKIVRMLFKIWIVP